MTSLHFSFERGAFYVVKCGTQRLVGKLDKIEEASVRITYHKCVGEKDGRTCFVEPGQFDISTWEFTLDELLYQLKEPSTFKVGRRSYLVFEEINDGKLFG